jgi:hypothetical protein
MAVLSGVLAAACGGGKGTPISPATPGSGGSSAGATITGTVNLTGSTGDAWAGDSPAAGVTVTVASTNQSATVNNWGYFELRDVPTGTVRLAFQRTGMNATADVPDVKSNELVDIKVQFGVTSATVVSDSRSTSKVTLCHKTESGAYHSITVSTSAEPDHRAHGDAKSGEPVPGSPTKTFDENCRISGPAVEIRKLTNGDDANEAPGPSIEVGKSVTWEYIVSNTGTIALTSVVVTDDRGVSVTCPSSSLAVGQSMTCTGSGVAVLGQYRNVGTVTASSTGGAVTDTDASHYLGVPPETSTGPKVDLCHRTGAGFYVSISVDASAEPAHRAHGDAKVGEGVPGQPGKTFGSGCSVN